MPVISPARRRSRCPASGARTGLTGLVAALLANDGHPSRWIPCRVRVQRLKAPSSEILSEASANMAAKVATDY